MAGHGKSCRFLVAAAAEHTGEFGEIDVVHAGAKGAFEPAFAIFVNEAAHVAVWHPVEVIDGAVSVFGEGANFVKIVAANSGHRDFFVVHVGAFHHFAEKF